MNVQVTEWDKYYTLIFIFLRDFKYLRIRFGGVKQQVQEKKDLSNIA